MIAKRDRRLLSAFRKPMAQTERKTRSRDPRHRAVTKRLRAFFGDLTMQLAAGTVELWRNVEQRVVRGTSNTDEAPSPYIAPLMQQQSVQQQQSKSEVGEGMEGAAGDKKTNDVNTGE